MEFLSIFAIALIVFGVMVVVFAHMLTGGNRWAMTAIVVSVIVAFVAVAMLFERVNTLAIIMTLAIVGAGAYIANHILIKESSPKEVKK